MMNAPLSKNHNLTLLFLMESVGIDKIILHLSLLLEATKFYIMHVIITCLCMLGFTILALTNLLSMRHPKNILNVFGGYLISMNMVKTSEGYYTYS
jgi:hypothetical protein